MAGTATDRALAAGAYGKRRYSAAGPVRAERPSGRGTKPSTRSVPRLDGTDYGAA